MTDVRLTGPPSLGITPLGPRLINVRGSRAALSFPDMKGRCAVGPTLALGTRCPAGGLEGVRSKTSVRTCAEAFADSGRVDHPWSKRGESAAWLGIATTRVERLRAPGFFVAVAGSAGRRHAGGGTVRDSTNPARMSADPPRPRGVGHRRASSAGATRPARTLARVGRAAPSSSRPHPYRCLGLRGR